MDACDSKEWQEVRCENFALFNTIYTREKLLVEKKDEGSLHIRRDANIVQIECVKTGGRKMERTYKPKLNRQKTRSRRRRNEKFGAFTRSEFPNTQRPK
jgi:hypothetical protein